MMSGAGGQAEPVVSPERGDRRFSAAEWREHPGYSLLKQSYLLNARLMSDVVEAAALDEPTKHKLRFYTRQFIDSMSPANFAATNPDVWKLAVETQARLTVGCHSQAGEEGRHVDAPIRRARSSATSPFDRSAMTRSRQELIAAGLVHGKRPRELRLDRCVTPPR
jgi:hypothetical protein